MRHTLIGAIAICAHLFMAGGCLTVPEGQFPVHGTDSGVIVHNYAMAFRDFLRSQSPASMVPLQAAAPLPFTDTEWYVDDVTTATPVTTTVAGVVSKSTVECGNEVCRRSVERTFQDGFRLDETLEIYYHRGVTDTVNDDRILGFTSLTRYPDQMLSQSAATEPAEGEPWVITTEYGFSAEDYRQAVQQITEYADLISGAVPSYASLVFRTKETATKATYEATAEGFAYAQEVTFENSRLVAGGMKVALEAGALQAEQRLAYGSGVEVFPYQLQGGADTWSFTGSTVARGAITGNRSASGWTREQVFPKEQRFKSLRDQGTWPDKENRGSFIRTITGQEETLTINGTYRLKAPGVWELNAAAEGGIRIELTFQSLPLADVWQGTWVQNNARSSSLDTANFTLTAHPDWTSQMTYTYDRADTPFTPDESGSIRMTPDSRGLARVSVVHEKAGSTQRHVDYTLRIVAEGQKP